MEEVIGSIPIRSTIHPLKSKLQRYARQLSFRDYPYRWSFTPASKRVPVNPASKLQLRQPAADNLNRRFPSARLDAIR
jgi:hypothetical protein